MKKIIIITAVICSIVLIGCQNNENQSKEKREVTWQSNVLKSDSLKAIQLLGSIDTISNYRKEQILNAYKAIHKDTLSTSYENFFITHWNIENLRFTLLKLEEEYIIKSDSLSKNDFDRFMQYNKEWNDRLMKLRDSLSGLRMQTIKW